MPSRPAWPCSHGLQPCLPCAPAQSWRRRAWRCRPWCSLCQGSHPVTARTCWHWVPSSSLQPGLGPEPAPCWGWCRSAWAAPGLLWGLRGPGGDRTAAGGCWGMRGAELHAHPQPSLAAALMLWLGESPACPARLSQALGLCPTGLGLPWPLRPQEGAPPTRPHFPTVPGIPVPASGAHILGKPAGSGRCPPRSPQVRSLRGGSAGAGAGPQCRERRWRGAGAGPARCRGARGHSRPARQNRTASFKDDQAVTGIKLCFDFLISLISSAPRYGVISPLRHDSSFPP